MKGNSIRQRVSYSLASSQIQTIEAFAAARAISKSEAVSLVLAAGFAALGEHAGPDPAALN